MNDTFPWLFNSATDEIRLFGALLLGASMGITACTFTCLPFMGSWILGRSTSSGKTAGDLCAFIAGRLTTYSLLGFFSALLGTALLEQLTGGYAHIAIGLVSTLAGLWLLSPMLLKLQKNRQQRIFQAPHPSRLVFHHATQPAAPNPPACIPLIPVNKLPPFFIGLTLSLSPCAPLGWLLGLCALSGNPLSGLGQGLAFGLGTTLTPLLLLIPLLGAFGRQLLLNRIWLAPWLQSGAGGVLLLLGIKRILFI